MIEVGSEVKFNGAVSSIGASAYNVDVKEFFIDKQWRRFVEPKVVSIATTDYDNHLTLSELAFIQTSIERIAKTMPIEDSDRAVADSIIKKLRS